MDTLRGAAKYVELGPLNPIAPKVPVPLALRNVRPLSMTVAKSIDQFCSYFEREAAAIGRVSVTEGPDIETGAGNQFRYRKTLYVTAIDTGVDFFLNHGEGNADAKKRNPLRYL